MNIIKYAVYIYEKRKYFQLVANSCKSKLCRKQNSSLS